MSCSTVESHCGAKSDTDRGHSPPTLTTRCPEVGECGFDRATQNLADLVLYKWVRLGVSNEDSDQYGRLLRYVDVGPKDAVLRLIQDVNGPIYVSGSDPHGLDADGDGIACEWAKPNASTVE